MSNIDFDQERAIASSLKRMGLLAEGEDFTARVLPGGVSCDVWRVTISGRDQIVKQALPKLRVSADWYAPAERSAAEVAWFKLVETIDARLAPKVLGEDRARHLFAMEFLPPAKYPLWKAQLARGIVEPEFAAKVGVTLARIHSATAGRDGIAQAFANDAQFHMLRLEPYLLHTADKHPDLAERVRDLADGVARARIALMHGDVSPKNILCGPQGPVFLDAETACYGDPAFDLAFCLNHLLLKCLWHPEYSADYLASLKALARSYLQNVTWESAGSIEARTAALLPALLLARIDGKSPVEYITSQRDKDFVRIAGTRLLSTNSVSLNAIAAVWRDALAAR